jgi:hypothetical protein
MKATTAAARLNRAMRWLTAKACSSRSTPSCLANDDVIEGVDLKNPRAGSQTLHGPQGWRRQGSKIRRASLWPLASLHVTGVFRSAYQALLKALDRAAHFIRNRYRLDRSSLWRILIVGLAIYSIVPLTLSVVELASASIGNVLVNDSDGNLVVNFLDVLYYRWIRPG